MYLAIILVVQLFSFCLHVYYNFVLFEHIFCNCVVPDNVHAPPPTEGRWKLRGGGGGGGGGANWQKFLRYWVVSI